MYAVVGCSECAALWIVDGSPETSQCPRCGTRRQHAKRRKFLETDDREHAREARAAMLAERQGEDEAFAGLASVAEMESDLDAVGPDDTEYLEGSGVDPDAVAAAGERASRGAGRGGASRQETVRSALSALEEPSEADVVAYAAERGVPESAARRILEKLVRAGEVVEDRGSYRMV